MTKLIRGLALAGAALMMLAGSARAQGPAAAFELISAAEAQREAQAVAEAPPEIRARGAAAPREDATSIRVVSPTAAAGAGVAAPIRIEAAFKAAPGARIVPGTFRVLYGLLKIDLTDRVKPHATITESGVVVEGAQVPDGQHRLILQVGDDQGNMAEQELRIRVGAAS